jgi:hypothetical protein
MGKMLIQGLGSCQDLDFKFGVRVLLRSLTVTGGSINGAIVRNIEEIHSRNSETFFFSVAALFTSGSIFPFLGP